MTVGVGGDLLEALVGSYEDYARAAVTARIGSEPAGLDEAVGDGRRWLQEVLERLLRLPYPQQERGPLEVFQEAMRFPTAVLRAQGHPPVRRDDLSRNALPGDIYDLAPASSRDLGEDVWSAHLAWGVAKAAAMTRETV